MKIDPRELLAATATIPLRERGYDDPEQWLAAFPLPPVADGYEPKSISTPIDEGHVRATFATIAELAGSAAELMRLDPADPTGRARAVEIARQVEEYARAVRFAVVAEVTE